MKVLAICLAFFVMPVLAQERLILGCDVEVLSTFITKGSIEEKNEKQRIQIDIAAYPELFGFKPWYHIVIRGSQVISLSFGSPPIGASHTHSNGEYIKNQSTGEIYSFYGKKNSQGGKLKDPFNLWIDRVTGLVEGGYTNFYEGSHSVHFIGKCKRVDQAKKIF